MASYMPAASAERHALNSKRFDALLLASASIVWWTNAAGELVEEQPYWQAYTGQTWDEYRGSRWTSCLHPDDRDSIVGDWAKAVASGGPYFAQGRIWSARYGAYRAFQTRGIPIRNERDEIVEWLGALTDVQDTIDIRISEARSRTQAEQLRALSDELRATLNTAGIGIARCSRDLRYINANETYATITGFPLSEIIGRPIVEVIGEAALATILPYIERVLTGERVEYETVIPYHKGVPNAFFRVVNVPDRDPKGSVIGWIACVADITASRQAELALAERNAQLALAEHNAQLALVGRAALVGCYAFDVNKGEMQISEGYAVIHGLPEGTTETTRREWRDRLHPEDIGRLDGLRSQTFSDRRGEYNVEYRIVLPNRGVRWIESRSFISYDGNGNAQRVVGVDIDVTERKRAEERQRVLASELKQSNNRLQLALDCAELGTWSLHLNTGRFENDVRDRRIHGHGQEAPPKTLAEMRSQVHPDDLSKLDAAFAELGHAGGSCMTEYRLAPRTVEERAGRVRWVAMEGIALRRANGRSEQFLGVTRDITERKKAEAALRESEARLAGQREALELALNGAPLETSLGVLVRTATDQLGEGVRAAFYLANPAHTGLHHVVGMPAAYAEAVDGFEIGPASLSCGLATHTGLPVLTPDVAKEPRWTPWFWLAEMFDFRGCWSFPIRTVAGRSVGTLAIYWRRPREATLRELELAAVLTATAAIIIARHTDAEQRDRAQDALRESEARLNAVIEGAADGILTIDEVGIVRSLNTAAVKMFGYAAEEVIGCNVSMLAPEPYRSAHDGYLKRYRETGEAGIIGTRREVEGRRKDGQTFPMDLAVAEVPTSEKRLFVGIVRDISERKRAEERQRTLVAELDHRVKNALATVSAVVSHTRPRSRSVPDFATALEGRLRSMAATHELLSARWWQGVSLTELVRRELAPYAARNNTDLSGPELMLRAEAGQAMAMVLHELATNAAKYGSLSTKKGRVSIRWDRRLNGQPRLVLEWQEMGGPPVIAPADPSYGTSTIRDLIPYELGGTVDLVFAPEGLQCRLELPGDWLSYDGEPFSQRVSDAHLRTGQGRI
jgi:PAS domain S-box-containing protein